MNIVTKLLQFLISILGYFLLLSAQKFVLVNFEANSMMIKKVSIAIAVFFIVTVWAQPAMALSAKGLHTLQTQGHAQADEYEFFITIEKTSPLQALLLRWLGVDVYNRLLSFPQYVTLESWAAARLARHF